MAAERKSSAFWGHVFMVLLVIVVVCNTIIGIYFVADRVNDIWPMPFLKPVLHPQHARDVRPAPKMRYVFEIKPGDKLAPTINPGEAVYELDRVRIYGTVIIREWPIIVANFLSVDHKANTSRWLFNGNERAILATLPLPVKQTDDEERSAALVAGLAMIVADADTNKDGVTGSGDRMSLYVYRMDGKAPEKVLTADRMVMAMAPGGKAVDVFSQNGQTARLTTYAVPAFKLLAQVPVAGMPEMAPPQRSAPYPDDED